MSTIMFIGSGDVLDVSSFATPPLSDLSCCRMVGCSHCLVRKNRRGEEKTISWLAKVGLPSVNRFGLNTSWPSPFIYFHDFDPK